MHKKYDEIKDIPTRKYEGYIWESGQKKPKLYDGDEDLKVSKETIDGYIIEALLYSKEEKISVHIRHNGSYQIDEYNLSKVDTENLQKATYLPHRLFGVEKVKFKQVWIAEKDENCEGMEVLKMKAIVFTGFINQ